MKISQRRVNVNGWLRFSAAPYNGGKAPGTVDLEISRRRVVTCTLRHGYPRRGWGPLVSSRAFWTRWTMSLPGNESRPFSPELATPMSHLRLQEL